MNSLIENLETAFSDYSDKADIFISNCKRFQNNDTFTGEKATVIKNLVGNDEVGIVNAQKDMQAKALAMYKHAVESFADKVDSAPNARLDFDTLDMVESDLKAIYSDVDTTCAEIETIAKEMHAKYGHLGHITVPDANPLRESLEELCGGYNPEAGFYHDLKQKIIDWDEEECAYIGSQLLDDGIERVTNSIIQANTVLDATVNIDVEVDYSLFDKKANLLSNHPKMLFNDDSDELSKDEDNNPNDDSENHIDIYKTLLSMIKSKALNNPDIKDYYQSIVSNIKMRKIEVYGKVEVEDSTLKEEQMNCNAEYIYFYLREQGWSKEAICGLLGNIEKESGMNPGIWEKGVNANDGGYGLVQFTGPNRKDFYEYMIELKYSVPEGLNELIIDNPKEAINCQLDYLIQSENEQWLIEPEFYIYFEDFPKSEFADEMPSEVMIPFSEYTSSKASPACLALIFNASYERSGNAIIEMDERGKYANKWYEYFKEYD